jgi:iron complex outermembrane receptor protein
MSELIQKNDNCATIRWKLLTGASALALLASSPSVAGQDADHPLLWIELGANADMMSGAFGSRFTAPFLEQTPTPQPFLNGSPVELQKPPRFTLGGEGEISLQPEGSDWIFSAGIRFGRANNSHNVHHQTAFHYTKYITGVPPGYIAPQTIEKFADTNVQQSERHTIVDFQVGKDVGLGSLGSDATSTFSAGVRLARFRSHSGVEVRARPDFDEYNELTHYLLNYFPNATRPGFRFPTYHLKGSADRSFNGVGPSLSWKASVPVAGNAHDGELSLDWGVNGALLFGRQKAKTKHQTTGRYFKTQSRHYFHTSNFSYNNSQRTYYTTPYVHHPAAQNRSRNVTVPNLGANIGISYRIEDAKLSIGYRADYFFGAMDGGIDAPKNTTLGFNGLYASISVGLGD